MRIISVLSSVLSVLALSLIIASFCGCTTDLSQFDVFKTRETTPPTKVITNADLGGQGGGSASSVQNGAGHRLHSVTIGGAISRDKASDSNQMHTLKGGLNSKKKKR